jgi:hypothetical protein
MELTDQLIAVQQSTRTAFNERMEKEVQRLRHTCMRTYVCLCMYAYICMSTYACVHMYACVLYIFDILSVFVITEVLNFSFLS